MKLELNGSVSFCFKNRCHDVKIKKVYLKQNILLGLPKVEVGLFL